jgi:hypothetical protein
LTLWALIRTTKPRRNSMVEITIQVPEALTERLAAVGDRLPEVLARGLDEQPPLSSEG